MLLRSIEPSLFLNLALLLGIGFLPFPTALLAEYARQGGSNSHTAAAIYSATMMLIGFAFLGIWVHLSRRPHLLGASGPVNLRRSINLSLVSPVVYGASIGLAFVSAEACFVVYGLAAAYFAFGPSSKELMRRLEPKATPPHADETAPAASHGAAGERTSPPSGSDGPEPPSESAVTGGVPDSA